MKNLKYFALMLIASTAAMGCSGNRIQPKPEGVFRFGILQRTTLDSLQVSRETREIPKAVDTHLPYYGFVLDPPGRDYFELQTISFLPGPPAQVKGNLVGNPDDYAKGIASRKNVFFDSATIGYKFNEGDPIGVYRLVIFVDGREFTSVTYEIK